MNFKTFTMICGLALTLVGCGDGITAREKACLDHGGTWATCTNEGRYQERQLAKIENHYTGRNTFLSYDERSYPPAEMGQSYTNYYGNPQYGYWEGGRYRFNDPYSDYAIQTNSFLLGAGLGGLAAYALTPSANRTTWESKHGSGWTAETTTAKKYYGKGGKEISKEEYARRKAQSAKDKAAYKKKTATKKASTVNANPVKKNPQATQKTSKSDLNLSKKPVSKVTKQPKKPFPIKKSTVNLKKNSISLKKPKVSIRKTKTPVRKTKKCYKKRCY